MELGTCKVKGCSRPAETVAIVSSADFAGAAELCQYHYQLAAQNAERAKSRRRKKKS